MSCHLFTKGGSRPQFPGKDRSCGEALEQLAIKPAQYPGKEVVYLHMRRQTGSRKDCRLLKRNLDELSSI